MNKETLRPETLFPDNPHEIRGMSKPYRAVRKAVQDPKEQLNPRGKTLGSVPGYRSTTEEIGPGTADQGSNIPVPGFRDPAAFTVLILKRL